MIQTVAVLGTFETDFKTHHPEHTFAEQAQIEAAGAEHEHVGCLGELAHHGDACLRAQVQRDRALVHFVVRRLPSSKAYSARASR